MIKLLPCPFCKGNAYVLERHPYPKICFYQIRCSSCSAMLEQGFTSKEDAIEAWNRRANNE